MLCFDCRLRSDDHSPISFLNATAGIPHSAMPAKALRVGFVLQEDRNCCRAPASIPDPEKGESSGGVNLGEAKAELGMNGVQARIVKEARVHIFAVLQRTQSFAGIGKTGGLATRMDAVEGEPSQGCNRWGFPARTAR